MKPGVTSKLLIDPHSFTTVTDRRGHDWVTDRYVIARRDCFKSLPAGPQTRWASEYGELPDKAARGVLDRARHSALIDGFAVSAGIVAEHASSGPQYALICARTIHVWVNAKAWQAWTATGLTPQINTRGQVLWFGTVRGNRTLLAVLMPALPNGTAGHARIWTTGSAA